MEREARELRRAEKKRRASLASKCHVAEETAEEKQNVKNKELQEIVDKTSVDKEQIYEQKKEMQSKKKDKNKNKKRKKKMRVPAGVKSMFKQQAAHDMAVALESGACCRPSLSRYIYLYPIYCVYTHLILRI